MRVVVAVIEFLSAAFFFFWGGGVVCSVVQSLCAKPAVSEATAADMDANVSGSDVPSATNVIAVTASYRRAQKGTRHSVTAKR